MRPAEEGPEEPRVPEIEDPAVASHHPVAAPVGRAVHSHDRRMHRHSTHGTEVTHIAEAEDATVRGDEPVTAPVGG